MLILFEHFLRHPETLENLTPEEHLIIQGLFDYIEGRLMPFKDEMEKLELAEKERGGMPDSCVIMHFPKPGITIHGYTNKMREKMVLCFSQLDVDPMWKVIEESLKTFLN